MAQKSYDDTEYQLNDNDDDIIYEPEEIEGAGIDAGTGDTSGPVDSSPKTKFSKLPKIKVSKKRIIVLIIIALLFLLVLYKLYSLIFGTSYKKPTIARTAQSSIMMPSIDMTKQPVITKPEVKQPEEKSSPVLEAPQKPEVTEQPSSQVAASALKMVDEQLQQFKAQNNQLNSMMQSQQIESQSRFSSLDNKISDLQASIGGLQTVIQGLSSEVQEAQREQKAYIKTQREKHVRQARIIREQKRYFVQAVIPGRAWLHGADGTSITVVKGDNVPGYGSVVTIDPYSGTVTTSSGFKIRYGISDD